MDAKLHEHIMACQDLPSVPSIACRVVDACRANASAADLLKLVSKDPALALKLLSTVNARSDKPVQTISEAIDTLGETSARAMLLGFSLSSPEEVQRLDGFNMVHFWWRANYAAQGALIAADILGLKNPMQAQLAGLLQDFGVLAMARGIGKPYVQFIKASGAAHGALHTMERQNYDTDHSAIGAGLALRWHLPQSIVVPIAYHINPAEAPEEYRPLAMAAALGSAIGDILLPDKVSMSTVHHFLDLLDEHFGETSDTGRRILTLVDQLTRRTAVQFQIQTIPPRDIHAVIEAANRELVHMTLAAQSEARRLRNRNHELAKQAATDYLTGVANRARLNDVLDGSFRDLQTKNQPLSLLMIDADHFKQINDKHGHSVGDDVLVAIAKRLQAAAPPSACVARYGGEEFAIILPGITLYQAMRVAERARAMVANKPIVVQDTFPLQVTLSIGVASAASIEQTPNPDALLRAADEALYQAKNANRNCVRAGNPSAVNAA